MIDGNGDGKGEWMWPVINEQMQGTGSTEEKRIMPMKNCRKEVRKRASAG